MSNTSSSKTNSGSKTNANAANAAVLVGQIAMDTLVEQIVPDVSKKMTEAGITISPSSVMQVLRIAMEAVEGAPIKGPEQKDLAIKIVLEIASGANLPENHLILIKDLVDGGLISDTIDIIVDATKGKLDVNKVTEVAKGCFARCFASMFKKNTTTAKSKKVNNKKDNKKNNKPASNQAPQTGSTPIQVSVVSMTPMEDALIMLPPKIAKMHSPDDVDVTVVEVEVDNKNDTENKS